MKIISKANMHKLCIHIFDRQTLNYQARFELRNPFLSYNLNYKKII